MTSVYLQKRAVERNQLAVNRTGEKWEPIAIEWYTKWKNYTDIDYDQSPREEIHPGPIDNSRLQGKYAEELRPGLVEEQDYVLLRQSAADILFDAYGGGPRFPRDTINVGTAMAPIYQVAVYRVRVEAFLCTTTFPTPDESDSNRHIVRFFSKAISYSQAVEALIEGFQIKVYMNAVRCWVRDDDGEEGQSADTNTDSSAMRDSPSAIERTEGGEMKRARVGRLLTSEVTDQDAPWRYLRHGFEGNIRELQGNGDCVRLLLEMAPERKPTPTMWPRAAILNRWKQELRVGDVFDARDLGQGKWYAAVAKEVSADGAVSVHYKGWQEKFDEVIPAGKVAECIEPLYTHTVDRREWGVDDLVDHRITPPDVKAVWIPARIVAVDPATDRVELAFLQREKDQALRKYGALVPAPPSTTAAVIDDDTVKRLSQATTPSPSLADIDEDGAVAEDVRVWCEMLGEDICPYRTHTKAPTAPVTVPALPKHDFGAGKVGGYVSNVTSAFSSLTKPLQNAVGRFDYSEKHVKGTTEVAGAVGLQNLGNTCFMNSILQCVSNTEAITKLFLEDRYKAQINTDNPLGHGGRLASAYAKLIKDMWSNAYSKIIPREFKYTIGEFQPQFAGYDQQDSQEFLGFLLDGLHEDLNRVHKKPHVTKIESKGRPDALIAAEAWRRHLLRNDSELVDRCFGQLKSHVTCTNCGNESVTFDVYSSLSLPLPVRTTRPITVIVQLLPLSSLPVKLDIDVEIGATMKQFEKLLVKRLAELRLLDLSTIGLSESTISMGQTSPADSGDESTRAAAMEVEEGSRTCTTDASKASSPLASDPYDAFELVAHPLKDGIACAASTASAVAEAEMEGALTTDGSDGAYVTVFSEDRMDDSHTSGSSSPMPCPSEDLPVAEAALAQDFPPKLRDPALPQPPSQSAGVSVTRTGPVFHLGTLFTTKHSSVFKHYNAAEHGSTAVHTFVGRNDNLMAFQLEHWAPEVRSTHHHYSSYRSTPAAVYDPADDTCAYAAVDVCMGSKVVSQYNNYERIEFGGYPYRLALPVNCTSLHVHQQVAALSRRFLKEESPYCSSGLSDLPYSLVVTSSYGGAAAKRTVEVNDEVFVPPAAGSEVLVVLWRSDFEEHVDQDQIDAVREPPVDADAAKGKTGGPLNIYRCFDKFSEREQLAESETLYCSACKQHLAPIKKMDLWSTPDILVIQLKRFQYIPGQYFVHREKISDVVDFPIEGLDLSQYVIGPHTDEAPPVYDLYAVSHHMGGLGGGHYTATCKNFLNNKWYEFNDSHVGPTDPERSVSGTAYVLFYKRRAGSLKWGGIVPSSEPLPDE